MTYPSACAIVTCLALMATCQARSAGPSASGDRLPTPSEFESAKKAFEGIEGSFDKTSYPWLESYNGCAPTPVTAGSLAKLPDLSFDYELTLFLGSDTSPDALKSLARLKQLRSIGLNVVGDDVPPQIVPLVAALRRSVPQLERLNLRFWNGSYLTDDVAAELVAFPSLGQLDGGACSITDVGLRSLARCPKLESLSIPQSRAVTDAGLAHLARMPTLRRLDVEECSGLTTTGVLPFANCPRLTELRIGYRGMTEDVLIGVGRITTLESLYLSQAIVVADTGFGHLGNLPRLRTLHGNNLEPTDAGVKALAGTPELERLVLRGRAITDEGYKNLGRLRKLKELNVHDAKGLTNTGLKDLAGLDRLDFFGAEDAKLVTEAGWRAFISARGSRLRSLYICGSAVTDAFVADLPVKSPELSLLGLYRCRGVTEKSVEPLCRLTRLTYLSMGATGIGPGGLKRLKERFPDADIFGNVEKRKPTAPDDP